MDGPLGFRLEKKHPVQSKIIWWLECLKKTAVFLAFWSWGSPRNGGIHTTTHNSYTRLVAAIDGNPTTENGLHVIIHEPVNTYYSNSLSGRLFSFFFSVFWLRVAMRNQGMISESGWILNFRRELLNRRTNLHIFGPFRGDVYLAAGETLSLYVYSSFDYDYIAHAESGHSSQAMPWCPIPVLDWSEPALRPRIFGLFDW